MMMALVTVVTDVEAANLWPYHHRTGKGLPGRDFPPALLSGQVPVLALRLHPTDSPWMPTTTLPAGTGVFYTPDLPCRWRRTGHQRHAINQLS